jgi:hypothetical protein
MEGKLKPFIFYIPTMEQIEYTKVELETKPFARRGYFDGNPYQKFLGLLNEVVICDLLGLPRPELPDGKPDKGYDIIFDNTKIDIKSRAFSPKHGDPRNPLYDHLIAKTQMKDAEVYLFTAVNPENKNIMVCGYLKKSDIISRGLFGKRGQTFRKYNGSVIELRADDYIVFNKDLDREGGTPLFRVETKTEGHNGTS